MNRRADVYRLDSFLARPSVCLPSATTVQLRLPEVAAVMVLLCWRIKVISGDGDEYGFIPGEIFGRSMTSSFCAIGECPSPASQVFADDDGSLAVDLDDLLVKSLILPVVLLFALGRDLLCSPVSFSFRVGVAGCGISGGLLTPVGGGNATLCSGDVELLELALALPPTVSSPISFQWLKIHLDRRSRVVVLVAFPSYGGCRRWIWKWVLQFWSWCRRIGAQFNKRDL